MTKTKKVVRTIVVAGVLCALASIATFSAFSSQADNPGNSVTTGTVALTENSGGSALYNMSNAKPGDSATKCIKVTYNGSLDSSVSLYTPSSIGTLGPYLDLKVETGSGTAANCSDFTVDASGSVLFNGKLNTFATASGSLVDNGPAAATKWVNGNAVTYRVTASLAAGVASAAQGLTTGTHILRWEAQNQ